MTPVNIIQNTAEWNELRKGKLGASDANIVMGVSKYTTALELWKIKKDKSDQIPEDPSFIQAKGHKLEEKIRAMHELDTGHDFPAIVVLSDTYPFLMASLDGFCQVLNEILECKYVGQEDFERVQRGEMLPQYVPQTSQQLLLTAASKLTLYVATEDKDSPEKGALKFAKLVILPDQDYIFGELLPAMQAFWKSVEDGKEPPLGPKDTLVADDNKDLAEALRKFKENKDNIPALLNAEQAAKNKLKGNADFEAFQAAEKARKSAEEREKKLRESVGKLLTHNRVECNGFKVLVVAGKPSRAVDYQRCLEDHGLFPDRDPKYVVVTPGKPTIRITVP